MQTELAGTDIVILGINRMGSESQNPAACEGKDIPWLQDTPGVACWDLWEVTYRDVYIVGRDNELLGVYNLTTNDLGDPADYAALKAMLENAAGAP